MTSATPSSTRWSAAAVGLLAFGLAFGSAGSAWACGAVTPSTYEEEVGEITDGNAAIDAQRAFVRFGEEDLEVHFQLNARSSTKDFAWLLPVPRQATLEVGDPALFEALDRETKPEVNVKVTRTVQSDYDPEGCGFGAAKSGGTNEQARTLPPSSVEEFAGGRLGDYQYSVLEADSSQALEQWLRSNDYAVSDALVGGLQPYLDQGLRVAAVRLSSDAETPETLDPLVVRRPVPADARMRYPLALSAASAPETTSLVLYVLGAEPYQMTPYASTDLEAVADQLVEQLKAGGETDYRAAVDTLADKKGKKSVANGQAGQPAGIWLHEYARNVGGGCFRGEGTCPAALADQIDDPAVFLTRLYARVPREDLQDVLVRPAVDGDLTVEPERSVTVSASEVPEGVVSEADAGSDAGGDAGSASVMALIVVLLAGRVVVGRSRKSGGTDGD